MDARCGIGSLSCTCPRLVGTVGGAMIGSATLALAGVNGAGCVVMDPDAAYVSGTKLC